MDDSQPKPRSPWAPESDELEDPDGVVLRSPAPAADSTPPNGLQWPWEVDPADRPDKVEAGPAVKTERLYRSGRFSGETKAEDPMEVTGVGRAGVLASEDASSAPYAAPAMSQPIPSPAATEAAASTGANTGFSTLYVALTITGATTVAAIIDMIINRRLTIITGIVFVLVCIFTAFKVRPSDLWTAVITPPLAFLVALIISGQVTALSGSGDLLLREATVIATGLAFNAPFVFGGTIAALIVVLVRRPKAKAALR
ncbi:MAG: DUF6542 domain-containing protein [Candidatus Nanopelagicales bacterium]